MFTAFFWRIRNAREGPTVRPGIVSFTSVRKSARGRTTYPDNHLAASPNRSVKGSLSRVSGARSYPTVGAEVISPAGVVIGETTITTTPYDHFVTGPNGRVKLSSNRCAGSAGSCPSVRAGFGDASKLLQSLADNLRVQRTRGTSQKLLRVPED
jgi:hypothetical protein